MKPLSIIYWSRVCLGITAAALCTGLELFMELSLLSSLSVAILVYMLTNYLLKRWFIAEVKDPSKIIRMGIGAYFLSWIVTWILLYSVLVSINA